MPAPPRETCGAIQTRQTRSKNERLARELTAREPR